MTPEFLEGPIAREYRDILEAATTYEASTRKKAGTGGKQCKSDGCNVPTSGTKCKSDGCDRPTAGTQCKTEGCNVPTGGKNCKTGDGCQSLTGGKNCKTGDGCAVATSGKACKSDRKTCPKKYALQASVPGWSEPPSPPPA